MKVIIGQRPSEGGYDNEMDKVWKGEGLDCGFLCG